jgi:type II secretory pathway component PulF
VRVGESAGILSENLNYLADELKKKQELRKKVIGALIYPIVILVATLGITGLLTVFIFPKILPVFKSLNVELPLTTKILIVVSDVLTKYGLLVLLGILALIVALWLILKIKSVKFYFHSLLLYVPIFGKIIRNVSLTNLCRTLGLTLKSGIKVVEAISITAESLPNLVYKKELLKVADEVRKGESLSPHFVRMPHLFPSVLSQMISVGESAGNLSETLLYLAEFYESEVNDATKNLSNVLEPILMVLMGIIVGFVALSIITPIYEVTQNIGRR